MVISGCLKLVHICWLHQKERNICLLQQNTISIYFEMCLRKNLDPPIKTATPTRRYVNIPTPDLYHCSRLVWHQIDYQLLVQLHPSQSVLLLFVCCRPALVSTLGRVMFGVLQCVLNSFVCVSPRVDCSRFCFHIGRCADCWTNWRFKPV